MSSRKRRLAMVFAHSDDDTFGVAGTVALHGDEVEVMSILATSGEAGEIAPGSNATPETLGRVREAEAGAAYAAAGRPADNPQDDLPAIFGREHYVLAWPEREPGAAVLADVFEGLEAPG